MKKNRLFEERKRKVSAKAKELVDSAFKRIDKEHELLKNKNLPKEDLFQSISKTTNMKKEFTIEQLVTIRDVVPGDRFVMKGWRVKSVRHDRFLLNLPNVVDFAKIVNFLQLPRRERGPVALLRERGRNRRVFDDTGGHFGNFDVGENSRL